jgi:hypothetical protein
MIPSEAWSISPGEAFASPHHLHQGLPNLLCPWIGDHLLQPDSVSGSNPRPLPYDSGRRKVSLTANGDLVYTTRCFSYIILAFKSLWNKREDL